MNRAPWLERAGVVSAWGLTSAAIAWLSARRYYALQSDWAFDLAFFHNLLFNAASGRGFVQSSSTHELEGLGQLSHAFFALPLLVPIYRLFPALETLLAVQAAALTAGAFSVRRIARSAGSSDIMASLLALGFLASFPVWRLGMADFRPIILSVGALLWFAAALCDKRRWEVFLSAALACLLREEVPVMVLALSLGLLADKRARVREVLPALALAGGYFLLQLALRPRSAYYIPLDRPETLLSSLSFGRLMSAEGSGWARHVASYLPLTLLPALASRSLMAALPLLIYLLLFSPYEWWTWQGPYVHHAAPLLAPVATAAALTWGRLEQALKQRTPEGRVAWLPPLLGLLVALQGMLTARSLHHTLGLEDDPPTRQARADKAAALEALLSAVPPQGRLACDYASIARCSGREHVYCYQSAFELEAPGDPASGTAVGLWSVDYVIVDDTDAAWRQRLEVTPAFERVDGQGGYLLFRRKVH